MKISRVCIVGVGYVGLTLGLTLAELGFTVTAVDVNKEVVDKLNRGEPNFHENGLTFLLTKHLNKRFFPLHEGSDGIEKLYRNQDAYVICVGTPIDENKQPILAYIRHASEKLSKYLSKGTLVVLRSTIPVGTMRGVVIPSLEKGSGLKAGKDFSIVFAPEMTAEGVALKELRELPQIIGGVDDESVELASSIFRKVTPTIVTVSSLEGAEMVKILDNTYRDVMFGYSNEIALISEKLGLDGLELIKKANVGYSRNNIPLPSPGVGGACLSKDPYILIDFSTKAGYKPRFVRLGREINEYMPLHVVKRVEAELKAVSKQLSNAKVFVVGFAFKGHPETSDMRNSPTLALVKELLTHTPEVYGYDPVVLDEDILKTGVKLANLEEGFKDADVVIFMNNHHSYLGLDIGRLIARINKPAVFYDGWMMFNVADIGGIDGMTYIGVGRG